MSQIEKKFHKEFHMHLLQQQQNFNKKFKIKIQKKKRMFDKIDIFYHIQWRDTIWLRHLYLSRIVNQKLALKFNSRK